LRGKVPERKPAIGQVITKHHYKFLQSTGKPKTGFKSRQKIQIMKKLLQASIILTVFAISIGVFQISSCKKATAQTTSTTSIEGLWVGTYTVDGQSALGAQYYSFIIKPDGKMIVDSKWANQQHLSIGTWTLNGNTLSCSFTCVFGISSNVGVVETSTATYDNTGKLTSGIWKNIPPLSGSGTFTLTKVL